MRIANPASARRPGCLLCCPGPLHLEELRFSHDEPLRQPVYRIVLTIANDVTVDPEGLTDVAMGELITNHSDRGAALN